MRHGPKALLCLVVTRRTARIVLVLAALFASAWAAAGVAAAPQLQHVPLPENPTPIPPEPVPVPPPSGPCVDTRMRCPDLIVRAPSELKVIRSRFGRVRLGSRNILVNRGAGPMYLLGRRLGRRTMTVRQRIFTNAGTFEEFPLERARFDFWTIPVPPGQGRFWKLRDGLRFELWTAGGPIERFVKFGRKTRFCMRDLREVPGMGGPRTRQFPACNQSPDKQVVRMGISVGLVRELSGLLLRAVRRRHRPERLLLATPRRRPARPRLRGRRVQQHVGDTRAPAAAPRSRARLLARDARVEPRSRRRSVVRGRRRHPSGTGRGWICGAARCRSRMRAGWHGSGRSAARRSARVRASGSRPCRRRCRGSCAAPAGRGRASAADSGLRAGSARRRCPARGAALNRVPADARRDELPARHPPMLACRDRCRDLKAATHTPYRRRGRKPPPTRRSAGGAAPRARSWRRSWTSARRSPARGRRRPR